MMIKTKRPAIAGTKYMSATVVGVAVGAVVVAGVSKLIIVSADEPKYELDPLN
jgi:predicted RNA-binding protein (virulence factor B family)